MFGRIDKEIRGLTGRRGFEILLYNLILFIYLTLKIIKLNKFFISLVKLTLSELISEFWKKKL